MRYHNYHTTPAKLLFDAFNGKYPNQTLVHKRVLTNMIEKDDHYALELAAPGLSKKDFVLTMEEYYITVKANLDKEAESMKNREFDYTKFERKVRLPKHIQRDKIKAQYKNGVLVITLPKLDKTEIDESSIIEIQ